METRIQDEEQDDLYVPQMPHMAQGGLVPFGTDPLRELTPGTSRQVAPLTASPPPPPTMAAPAPLVPTASAAPAPAAPVKLPGMPPDVSPDAIGGYLAQQRSKLNRFGPDQRLQLQDSLNQRQNSFGNRATSGLKGFADALMMGVARAGNPNWQGQYEANEQQFAKDQIDAFDAARSANTQEVESGMTLDRMDPSSDLSKQAQATYAPLFEKLGYQPSAVKNMSADKIESALSLMTQFGGMEIQAAIKQFEAEIERMRLAAAAGKESAADERERQKMKKEAADAILKRSGNARIWGIPVPFTSDVSGDEEDAARAALMEQVTGPTTAPASAGGYLKTATNPKTGARVGTRDGKTWEPIE